MSLAPWVSHGNHIASFGNKAVTMRPMSIRAQILLLILLPLAAVALLVVSAQRIPLPEMGRGYVLRVELPRVDRPALSIAFRSSLSFDGSSRGHGRPR